MDRILIERRIEEYVESLAHARSMATAEAARAAYDAHRRTAQAFHSRWQGGESAKSLADALAVELTLYRNEKLPGNEAESVGRALGTLCRSVGLRPTLADFA